MKKALPLIFAINIFFSTPSYSQNGWVQRSNGPAKGRTGCFVIGNYGYYGAGNDNPGPSETNTWFRYDPITDSWSSIANMPMGLQAIEGFSINGKGYAGIGFAGGSSHADFFEYDTSSNAWTAKASYPGSGVYIPHDAGSFVLNGEGYILGGAISYSNATQAACNKFNPTSNTWTPIASLPSPKRVALGASINGYGYAFFGQNPYNSGVPDTACYKYDPIADSWTSIPSAPIYSERYSSFVLNGKLFLICNADSTYNDFYEFDPTNNTWTQLPFRPTSFIAQATFVINNRAFVIFHTGEVWEYTPPATEPCDTLIYGAANGDIFGQCIKANDGNIVTVGTENSFGNWVSGDIVLKKYDSNFNMIWSKVFAQGGGQDYAYRVFQTSDGGYLINHSAGNTFPNGYFSASYIIKTDSAGNQEWMKSLGGTSYGDNYGLYATENSLGEFVLYGQVQYHPGCSNYSTRITKISSTGSPIWSYCWSNSAGIGGFDKLQLSNNYISLFNDQSTGSIQIVKWDDNGSQTGTINYRYSNLYSSSAISASSCIKRCLTGGFFVFGNYDSTNVDKNAFLAKFDDNLNLLWEKGYNHSANDNLSELITDASENIFAVGSTKSTTNDDDLLLLKFDSSGNYITDRVFGYPNKSDFALGVCIDNTGEVICSGSTGDDALLVKFCDLDAVAGNNCNPNITLSISTANASCPGLNDGYADLTVSGAGTIPLTYLWSNGETNEDISGLLTGTYTVTVSYGSGCSVTSSVNIVSTGAEPVALVTPAGPLTTCSNITLIASGGGTYQWLKNGVPIAGAVSSNYKASATANYAVKVENSCGIDTSNIVSVIKYPQPSLVLTTSGSTTLCQNGKVTINAYSNAGINASYQWQKNNINISGATFASYTATQSGNFRVIVTNTITGCTRTSTSVKVTKISFTATITANGPTTVCKDNVLLSVVTNAGVGATYQWKKNGVNIPNGTNPTYSTKDPGVYRIVVTNSNGCTMVSNSITITISCREAGVISEEEILINPNPTNNYADINYSLTSEYFVRIEVFNLVGERVLILFNKIQKEGDQRIRIQSSDLSPGFYFVNLTIGNRVISKKLVVQR